MAEKMVQVRATAVGFDNINMRQPGDIFLMPESAVILGASWFERVKPPTNAEQDAEQSATADAKKTE